MGDLKFKFMGIILVFVTISLVFKMNFTSQLNYVFDKFNIDVEELTEQKIEKILGHSVEDVFVESNYTYARLETVENTISEEKYSKLVSIIDLEKDYSAIVIRAYEIDGYLTVRYYVNLDENETISSIIASYQKKLINAGYEANNEIYRKNNIEIQFLNKWDCITLIVKGV